MDKALIADSFSRLNLQIFPFAYSLIYDELQAQQLIIDAISLYVARDTDALEDYCAIEDFNSKELRWFEISKEIYRIVFQIARKRFDQVRSSLDYDDQHASFYSLSVVQRGVLFLKYQTEFEEADMLDILGVDYLEYRQLQATADMNISLNNNGQIVI